MKIIRARPALALAGCLALSGCAGLDNLIPPPQADPTRYFVLAAPEAAAAPAPASGSRRLLVGLDQIQLAGYLQERAMVVRRGTNEIAIEDYDRWAEPLGDGVARLLRARLRADPIVKAAPTAPFTFEAERDYDVAVSILRCEGATDADGRGSVKFAASYAIERPGVDPRVVLRREFAAPEADWDGKDFARLAALLSDAVNQLGGEIAASLDRLSAAPPPPAPGR